MSAIAMINRRPFSTPKRNITGMTTDRKITPISKNPMMISQDSSAFSHPVIISTAIFPTAEIARPHRDTKNPRTYLLKTNARREMGRENA